MFSARDRLAELLRPEGQGGLPGWCSAEKGAWLFDAAIRLRRDLGRPLSCVEVGVYGGRSLLAVALALRECDGGYACGIDPYTRESATEAQTEPRSRDWWASEPRDWHHVRRAAENA